ncbi:MAG: hypothetical protein IMZ69_11945, partial [Spirochaetes bacterium]|nr:hypothetical protein [Spirochaetota bacterium]
GAHGLFYLFVGLGKRARRRKQEDEAAECAAIVPELKAENSDFRRCNERLARENAVLRELVEEDDNHGRNWRARVHAAMGKGVGG